MTLATAGCHAAACKEMASSRCLGQTSLSRSGMTTTHSLAPTWPTLQALHFQPARMSSPSTSTVRLASWPSLLQRCLICSAIVMHIGPSWTCMDMRGHAWTYVHMSGPGHGSMNCNLQQQWVSARAVSSGLLRSQATSSCLGTCRPLPLSNLRTVWITTDCVWVTRES